jgi:acyl-ACP thioesterase
MIPPKCEQELSLPCYFFDVNKNLRPASFFDLAQEIAVQGSAMVGAPDWVLKDRDIAWILSRMHVRFEQYPRLYDKVLLQTWHSGISGPLYTRDYLMLDADGNVLVRATSSWILMEISTRSITRVDRIFDLMSPEPQYDGRALDANAPKVVWPKGLEPEYNVEHTVQYSDTDYNGHANNARYPVWAYDALPLEMVRESHPKDFFINYTRELHPGETVQLAVARRDPSSWLVEGTRDGMQNFICRVDF